MPARLKLTDADVKKVRRRVRAGVRLIDLADEFGVSRKTLWRRLSALERDETERATRTAEKRLRRQAAREKQKLLERDRATDFSLALEDTQPGTRTSGQGMRARDPYHEWLDRRKNLSGRALAEATGLVRLAKGKNRRWVDRTGVSAYLEAGWLLDD